MADKQKLATLPAANPLDTLVQVNALSQKTGVPLAELLRRAIQKDYLARKEKCPVERPVAESGVGNYTMTFSTGQAARKMGVHFRTLQRWIHDRTIDAPAVQFVANVPYRLWLQSDIDLAIRQSNRASTLEKLLGSKKFRVWGKVRVHNMSGSMAAMEQHYSVPQVAALWGVSRDTVTQLFENEEGVLVLGRQQNSRTRRKYRTLKIPLSVMQRVHNDWTNGGK